MAGRNRDSERAALFVVSFISVALLAFAGAIIYAITTQPDDGIPERQPRPQFGTLPPDCGHLYNANRHAEWRDCMGVGTLYIKKRDNEKIE